MHYFFHVLVGGRGLAFLGFGKSFFHLSLVKQYVHFPYFNYSSLRIPVQYLHYMSMNSSSLSSPSWGSSFSKISLFSKEIESNFLMNTSKSSSIESISDFGFCKIEAFVKLRVVLFYVALAEISVWFWMISVSDTSLLDSMYPNLYMNKK